VNGKVYAIEKEEAALELIAKNKKKFKTPNLEIIAGKAPDAIRGLPVPTHAFIGGSSGNMRDIIRALLEKNPSIRIVANSVTLETLTEILVCSKDLEIEQEEIICVSVARSRVVGGYNLMTSQNPVYITVWRGKGI
jgi:precorrin-6B C5,15-methyltransferase / cobalt-precorrin-6B C5,C15-methyltransferase